MSLKIFVDFDVTVAQPNVGNALFLKLGGERSTMLAGECGNAGISAVDRYREEAAALGTFERKDFDRFIQSHPIDVTFEEFVSFCRDRNIQFHVLSDGLDSLIRGAFSANRIRDVSYFANTVQLLPEDDGGNCKVEIQFPYTDAECTRCACCKRNIMLTHAGDEDVIAYVGQGYSNCCPEQYADIIFAKNDLQKFCQQENISYFLFDTFRDVVNRLEKLLVSGNGACKRRRAELMRRSAFMQE
jgi:2-hydroxy-3-keto-5-methylthiopentenyl-1-phosphate phosphatase